MTGLTRGSQVRLRCFQGFLTSSSIFVVDVTLTAVQPCFKEGDLINPVALVLALMVSHSLRKNPVHAPFIEEDRPSCWKDGLSRSFLHGFPLSRSGGGVRVQPIYDRNGVDSPMSRFRHPCFPKTGTKPYAIAGERRSVGLFKRLGPRFQVVGSLTLMSAPRRDGDGIEGKPRDGEKTCEAVA